MNDHEFSEFLNKYNNYYTLIDLEEWNFYYKRRNDYD